MYQKQTNAADLRVKIVTVLLVGTFLFVGTSIQKILNPASAE
jgi:hypothetical protein